MGAPAGHPFFGNQFTDGGYILGSFKYDPVVKEKGAEILNTVVSKTSQRSASEAIAPTEKISSKWLNQKNLIRAGALIVVTVGGIFIYKHISKKKAKKENIQSISLNVGICEKCNKPLIGSEYVPANDDNDNAHIVCNNCGEKNYAKYSNE